MNKAPKKIWVDEICVAGITSLLLLREEQFGCQEYIRADLVDGLVEALEVAMATFRFYEGYHSRKGSSLKEQQNKEFADVMEAALKALEEK